MARIKEVSLEIKGYPYSFSRRLEQTDMLHHLYSRRDYVPFLVVVNLDIEGDAPQDRQEIEILFSKSPETLAKLKDELGENAVAEGMAMIHRSHRKIDRIDISSIIDSTPSDRRKWLEEAINCINPAILCDLVHLDANQREFYATKPSIGLSRSLQRLEIRPFYPTFSPKPDSQSE